MLSKLIQMFKKDQVSFLQNFEINRRKAKVLEAFEVRHNKFYENTRLIEHTKLQFSNSCNSVQNFF